MRITKPFFFFGKVSGAVRKEKGGRGGYQTQKEKIVHKKNNKGSKQPDSVEGYNRIEVKCSGMSLYF